jgi:hypothetical protein
MGKWNSRHDDWSAADMSRSGNLAEWERRLAAQRREDERLTRERARREKEQEKVRQQSHHDAEQRTADEQAAAVQEQIKNLDEVLSGVLPLPPMSFDRLMATPRTPRRLFVPFA